MYRKMRVEETHQMNMAVKVRIWGGGEEGDRDGREGKTAGEGLNTQNFWSLQNKAPESVTFPLFLQYSNRRWREERAEGVGSHLCTSGLLDQGYLQGWEMP